MSAIRCIGLNINTYTQVHLTTVQLTRAYNYVRIHVVPIQCIYFISIIYLSINDVGVPAAATIELEVDAQADLFLDDPG